VCVCVCVYDEQFDGHLLLDFTGQYSKLLLAHTLAATLHIPCKVQ